MNILLVKPISDNYYVIQPNIGLGILASIMIRNNHTVRILDSGKEKLKWDDFEIIIKEEKFDIIGFQMFSHEVPSVKKHIDLIAEHSSHSTVLLGGPHVSSEPKDTMKLLSNVDFGFVAEAEIGIEQFIKLERRDYKNFELLSKIKNLIWRQDDRIIINHTEAVQNLDELDYPAWDIMAPDTYPTLPHGSFCKTPPVAPIIISRGCPFQCTFCAGHLITGRRMRYRSVENVMNEIYSLYQKYGVREFHIEDDNFTINSAYVIRFCRIVIESELNIAFALPNGIRLDTLDEEVLTLMGKAGFYSMAIGIESGSDKILRLMKKRLSTTIIEEKINLIKNYTNIKLTGFFLIGYPGETETDILKTISFSKSIKIDKASFMFVMPLPGSELWDKYKQKNEAVDWKSFFYYRIVPNLSIISEKKLRKYQRRAIVNFYLRARIIFGIIKEIRTFSQFLIIIRRILNIFSV